MATTWQAVVMTEPGVFTGKERDAETGLDYFGARYMSAAQGRFTSPDMAGPDLTNPQTFNKYRYALNNPLRYVDPNGLYEEDVHRNLTYALALATGVWSKTAERIAQGDQGVDDNPATSPMGMMPCCGPEQVRTDYHFTSPERRSQMYGVFERSHMAEDLGVFLHAEQDSFSHAGYGAAWGHARDGHTPDKTYSDPAKADRMAKDTFDILMGASSQFTRSGPAVSWKAISPYVQRFNRAGEKDKRRAFNDLVNAVWGARSEEMRREADRRRTGACSAEFSSCEGQ
jgi:RHS repeat-associated protein